MSADSLGENGAGPDLNPSAEEEIRIRQGLVLVALGRAPADRIIRVGRWLNVHTLHWESDWDIVIKGRRIAWVGPGRTWRGTASEVVEYPRSHAAPGFGEVHKHIESTHLTPEYEAALVIPRGNTWTCECSHEFSNVAGERNLEFWLEPRRRGSPLKIFPLPGSAVPPTAYEWGGGHYQYEDQRRFMRDCRLVPGLDEVMDWPAVWNPQNPSYNRLWGMMRATLEQRGVVEGHGKGLLDEDSINAFAAAGIASDHEVWGPEEAWRKLSRGLFVELRPYCYKEVIPYLLQKGLTDWSHVALTTDDRSVRDTYRLGAIDYNLRYAIELGVPVEAAYAMVTRNPARHMRLDHWVGSATPGRYADIVLLRDPKTVDIAGVYADGQLVAENGAYLPGVIPIEWPAWATDTIHIQREITPGDFRIPAALGRTTMSAAVLYPYCFDEDFQVMELSVKDGAVQRDLARGVSKFAIVERFSGEGRTAKMFWCGTGPADPDSALACSVAHDKHNIWVVGSSDEAMALAVGTVRKNRGGWALVHRGKVIATVSFEVGGLMACRPAEAVQADMERLYQVAEAVRWLYDARIRDPRFKPGFPERLIFSTLTCAPWRWVLVAPFEGGPQGLVNVATGQTHPVVW